MTDFFALLGLPRSPVLSLEDLKFRHHQCMTQAHPDKSGASHDQALSLNEARRILSDPALRVRHFLELQGVKIPDPLPPHVDWALAERIGALASTAATFTPSSREKSALLKAVNQQRARHLACEISNLQNTLRQQVNELLGEVPWHPKAPAIGALSALVFLQKQIQLLQRAAEAIQEKSCSSGPL